jgi:hypothetical protein
MPQFFRGKDEDLEKATQVDDFPVDSNTSNEINDRASDGAVPGESFEYGNSWYARIQRIAGRFHVDQRGIERVPENERTDTSYFNIGSMVSSSSLCFVVSL